jgi:hypothetical protein
MRPGRRLGRIVFPATLALFLSGTVGAFGGTDVPATPSLEIELSTDRTTYASADTALATLTVINRGDTAVTLDFASGQRYEFELRGTDDTLVWRWSDGRGFIQMLGQETIAPRERLAYEERIPLPRVPGEYRLIGMLASASSPGPASVELRVE